MNNDYSGPRPAQFLGTTETSALVPYRVNAHNPCPQCGEGDKCVVIPQDDVLHVWCERVSSDFVQDWGLSTSHLIYYHRRDSTGEPLPLSKPRIHYIPKPLASETVQHTILSEIAHLLPLLDHHRDMLQARGYTDESIARHGFVSLPENATDRYAIGARLLRTYEIPDILGIYGMVQDSRHNDAISWLPQVDGSALIEWRRNEQGNYTGFQYTPDIPTLDKKGKVTNKHVNPPRMSPKGEPHIAKPATITNSDIWYTEGIHKANLTAEHSSCIALGALGIGNYKAMGAIAPILDTDKRARHIIAIDNDIWNGKDEKALAHALHDMGFQVCLARWDGTAKGPDDAIQAGATFTISPWQEAANTNDSETSPVVLSEPADYKTELGNAHRFIKQYGDKVRYVYLTKKWMYYDGTRWVYDTSGQVKRWAKACVISLLNDAATCEDDNQRKAIVKHAMTSQSNKSITGMLALAESERPLQLDELDTNPWLLNLKNGTFNLETNTLQPHNRLDYISKIANVTYDPQATAPRWITFVKWATCDNDELSRYLQRAIGYGATGVIREHAMFIAYGTGANGKSTFFSTIQGILGDYAQAMRSESLMVQPRTGSGANSDIASLRGSRFVVSNEGEENSRLAESLIKDLTDGLIRARHLYSEEVQFTATHKLFFSTNHKPTIRGTDNGIWRRMKMIPFANTLQSHEQDTHLPDKLANESSGILNWIIAGCTQWRLNGLGTCETVDDATKGYRNEMDIIAGFIDDCCITTLKYAQVKSSEIYKAYVTWCEDNGERATSQKKFGMSLIERGFTQRKGTAGIRLWDGIGLAETSELVARVAHDDHFTETFSREEKLEKVYVNTPKRATRATNEILPTVVPDVTPPVYMVASAAPALVDAAHVEPTQQVMCKKCGKVTPHHVAPAVQFSPLHGKGAWSCNLCLSPNASLNPPTAPMIQDYASE